MTPLDAAQTYIRRGWYPIPIPAGSKAPTVHGWQNLRLTDESAPRYFNGARSNMGILLAESGLVDVDLDCAEALAVGAAILPPTLTMGRASTPRSHFVYRTPEPVRTTAFRLGRAADENLVEVRCQSTKGTPHQTVFPPSVHPTGEAYTFADRRDPAEIAPAAALRLGRLVAAGSVVARLWPAPTSGVRHAAALAWASVLLRSDATPAEAAAIIGAAATFGGDDDVDDRVRAVASTAEALAAGRAVTGAPTLVELHGATEAARAACAKALAWMGFTGGGLPGERAGQPHRIAMGVSQRPLQPLRATLPTVEPLAPGSLPDVFRAWILDVAERMQTPPDFAAACAVVTASAALSRRLTIRPKRYDDWTVVPNLWGGIVGRPSALKSPSLRETTAPLVRLEREAAEAHAAERAEFDALKAVNDARAADIKKEVREAVRSGANPADVLGKYDTPEPVRRRYLVNDPTVEALQVYLAQNPAGVCVLRDEFAGVIASMEKQGQEAARAFYLEAWPGDGSFSQGRIGRGDVHISGACVSILGGTQPGVLAALVAQTAGGGRGADGLLPRFQVLVWPDLPPEYETVDRAPNRTARDRAFEAVRRLAHVTVDTAVLAGAGTDPHDDAGLPFLRFSDEGDDDAQTVYLDWHAALMRRLRAGSESAQMEDHLGKYPSLVPSLALVFHALTAADCAAASGTPGLGRLGPVPRAALDKALAWARYLESHARRVYGSAESARTDAARTLARRVLAGDLPATFALRDVYRKGWSGLATKPDAEAAVDVLVAAGWLAERAVEPGDQGGRPGTLYDVPAAVYDVGAALLTPPRAAEPKHAAPDRQTDRTDTTPPVVVHAESSVGFVSASVRGSVHDDFAPDDTPEPWLTEDPF